MRLKPFPLILFILFTSVLFSYWETINKFLGIFGIGFGAIGLYFLNKIIDKRVDKAISWSGDKIGFKKRKPKIISTFENDERNKKLLDGLCEKVESLCQSNINLIQSEDLQFIDTLNWNITSKSKQYRFKGKLSDVVNKYQSSSLTSFAVIGEAGVGKTSAIYDFILERLKNKGGDLIPVFFSLSSWKKNQSLEDWLVRELDRTYHLDKKIGEYFIKDFKIFPFLDGFDQMSQEMREKCILEVYEYSKNNPIGLTSRPKVFIEIIEYLEKKEIKTEHLFGTYELKPLTSKQVQEITGKMSSKNKFQEVFEKSKNLKNFARYPMALFILTKIINDFSMSELAEIDKSAGEDLFQKLWKKYDEHIFSNSSFIKERNIISSPRHIRQWLKRIALERDSSFFIEELQPLYLSSNGMRVQYYLISRLAQCICIGISVGFFMSGALDTIPSGILAGYVAATIILLTGSQDIKELVQQDLKLKYKNERNRTREYIKRIFIHLIPLMPILCMYFGFSTPRSPEILGEMRIGGTFSTTETNVGFLTAVFMALILGFRSTWQNIGFDIRLVEKMNRDWKKFFQYGVFGGCFLGVFLILVAFFLVKFFGDSGFGIWLAGQTYISNTYGMAFVVGLVFGFCLFGIIGYLKEQDTLINREEKKKMFKPNFGVQRSFLNALKAGAMVTFILIISYGGFIYLMENETTSFVKAVKTSMAFGILGFLWFGGLDVLSHYCLRLTIYFDNSGPLNYISFLEQASSLRFIRIVGSGYEFMHPTIREYFLNSNFNPSKSRKLKISFIPVFCILCMIPIFQSLHGRFNGSNFWETELEGLKVTSKNQIIEKIYGSEKQLAIHGLGALDTVNLEFIVNGKIKVGTFTGYINAGGTEGGFFGMGIKDIYDQPGLESFQHGVLALRKKGENKWRAFPNTDIYDIVSDSKKLNLRVCENDTIEFIINDREFHNNSGRFVLSVDTIKTHNKMQVISHRGAAGLAPENSLEAIKKAMELNITKIEIDIQMSSDGELVVMHDKKVNRTTNGKGRVKDLNMVSLKRMELKNEFNINAKPLRIPTLVEVFDLIKTSNVTLLIEVKNPELYEGIDIKLSNLIKKYKLQKRVEVFSFNEGFTINFKNSNPEVFVGQFLISPFKTKITNADAVGIYYHSLLFKRSFLKKMNEQDIKVYAWSVNTQRGMQRLIDLEVDGIITDYPNLLQTTLGY